MNVEVVQKRLWEQSQQHRKHRESDTPLFPLSTVQWKTLRKRSWSEFELKFICQTERNSAQQLPRTSDPVVREMSSYRPQAMTSTAGPLILKLEAASMAARVSTVEKAAANMIAKAANMIEKAVANIGRLLHASCKTIHFDTDEKESVGSAA